jgi:hypothetical protein
MADENNNQIKADKPGTLDVYKTNPVYKLRQKLRWMTPKKKIVVFLAPVLVIAVAASLYFIIAAPGDPAMRLVHDVTVDNINGQTLECGNSYIIRVLTDVSSTSHSNEDGIVTAGAFLKYDPAVVTNVLIDTSTSAYDTDAMARVNSSTGVIEIIRGKPSPGLNSDNLILAKISATISPTFVGNTSIRFMSQDFSDAAENHSVFIEDGGRVRNVDFSADGTDGSYNLAVTCNSAPCSGEICAADETCPGANWENVGTRCCNDPCVKGTELYLSPSEEWINSGDVMEIKLLMSPDVNGISEIKAVLEMSQTGILNISDADVDFSNSPLSSGTATVSGQNIILDMSGYTYSGNSPVELAILSFRGGDEGDVNISFNKDGAGDDTEVLVGSDDVLQSTRGGTYHVTAPTVRVCPNTNLIVTPNSGGAQFDWCVVPDNATCTVDVSGGPNSGSISSSSGGVFSYGATGLSARTYNYTLDCLDPNGVYATMSTVSGSFSTTADTNLVISDVVASDITAHSASISWQTNIQSSTYVYYGETSGTHNILKTGSSGVTYHSVDLQGLEADTSYYFYVMSSTDNSFCSAGASGSPDCAASGEASFKTSGSHDTEDANIILKTDKNRICDEWLYCNASVQMLNTKKSPPKYEDMCFSVGKCSAIDKGGSCINISDNQDELSYDSQCKDKDTGNCDVDKIKNLSGLSKVGIDWGFRCSKSGDECSGPSADCGTGSECVRAVADGYFPYSVMSEVGMPVGIPNSSFGDGSTRPWKVAPAGGVFSNYDDNGNKVLRIKPAGAYNGVTANKLASSIDTGQGSTYVVSFRAKTSNPHGQNIIVSVGPYGGGNGYTQFKYYNPDTETEIDYVPLESYWQEYVLSIYGPDIGSSDSDELSITIAQAPGDNRCFTAGTACGSSGDCDGEACSINQKAFYIDNVNMKSVLQVAEGRNYVARSCRMYPTDNAPACDYYDNEKKKDYQGWKGYCIETDPGYLPREFSNQPMCLNWWPVDIIQGESNIFSGDEVVGYKGRKPLYYCIESAGNYNREGIYGEKGDKGYVASDEVWFVRDGDGLGTADYAFLSASSWGYSDVRKDEVQFVEVEIEYNSLDGNDKGKTNYKLTLGRENDWSSFVHPLEAQNPQCSEVNNWLDALPYFTGSCNSLSPNGASDCDLAGVKFDWNYDGLLKGIQIGQCDGSDGSAQTSITKITYYLREPCNLIAKVVTEDGEATPWASRIQKGGWPASDQSNALSYGYDQDYYPYGAAVADSPDYDPNAWPDPLYTMPANTSGMQSPYQVRAGSPYGAGGDIGKTQCVSGAENKIGGSCRTIFDCGYSIDGVAGLCVGINLNGSQVENFENGAQNYIGGQSRLSNLFARSYGVWKWELDTSVTPYEMRYVQQSEADDIFTYGWDITDSGNDPIVGDMKVNGSESGAIIISQGAAILEFTSKVDENQVPLVAYTVDWGDGTRVSESGLRIKGRDKSNPHTLVHYYMYDPNCNQNPNCTVDSSGANVYSPTVVLEDNWGQKNTVLSGTFGNIFIYEDEGTLPGAILQVSPSSLIYYDKPAQGFTLPFPQTFTITNANFVGSSLAWTLGDVTGLPAGISYTLSPAAGSTGVLGAGESANVTLTITSSGAITDNTYRGTITIDSDTAGSEVVDVVVEVQRAPPPPRTSPIIQDFVAVPSSGNAPLPVTVTADVISVDDPTLYPISVEIAYGDGSGDIDFFTLGISDSTVVTSTHTFDNPGTYTVSVIAQNALNELGGENITVNVY